MRAQEDTNFYPGSDMRIYFVETALPNITNHAELGVKNYLVSYWYDKKLTKITKIRDLVPDADIILDSGAYSAFQKKVELKLETYVDFVKKNQHLVNHVVGLDVIKDPSQSMENFDKMRSEGLNVIPTFHAGSDVSYLKEYCKKADYIAIGGVVYLKFSLRLLFNYLQNLLDIIPKDKKVHIFGTTNFDLLFRYGDRVTSVDSSIVSRRSAYNDSLSITGIPRLVQAMPHRITEKGVTALQKAGIYRILQMESLINEKFGVKT